MTATEVAFPIGATTQELVDKKGTTYDVSSHTVTRTGEDGAIPILHMNVGDSFNGEILEGGWHKGWDANISTFCATIDSGTLRLTGVAAIAGTFGRGWINSFHPVPLLDELEVTVSMEVPVDDTGAVASRDMLHYFYIRQDKTENHPVADDNYVVFYIDVDETGLILRIAKKVNGAFSQIASGYDYTMDTTRSTGDLEATIWRIVFNGKPGTPDATMSVYLKQSDTLANAESATEYEVTGSPFDISDLEFDIGYPAYQIYTQNTTYFGTAYDSANRAASGYLRVNYPQFDVNWGDDTITDDGSVMLFDGDPDSDGVRVYDKDHTFANSEIYLQNGLIRSIINEDEVLGLDLACYAGSSWSNVFNSFYFYYNAGAVGCATVLDIVTLTPEKIKLKIRLRESLVIDNDHFTDIYLTMYRGCYAVEIEPITIYPEVDDPRVWWVKSSNIPRFGYIGDDQIYDDDLQRESGDTDNSTMSDNYLIQYDDEGTGVIWGICLNKLPTTKYTLDDAGGVFKIDSFDYDDLGNAKIFIFAIPFDDNENLFVEAEDATISASAREWLVGSGDDTETEGDSADWVATNCVITDDADSVVGAQSIKITSSGAGDVVAEIAVDNLKVTKFDSLKFYIKRGPVTPVNIILRITDISGWAYYGPTYNTNWAQKTVNLPHSATDLGGFTQNSFGFGAVTHYSFRWTATGAGEELYIDGLHEYIGTTTTRGRGETLSGGEAVVLDEINDRITYEMNPVSNYLPEGKYLLVWRLKDTDQERHRSSSYRC